LSHAGNVLTGIVQDNRLVHVILPSDTFVNS
jgi:hypothetical protein